MDQERIRSLREVLTEGTVPTLVIEDPERLARLRAIQEKNIFAEGGKALFGSSTLGKVYDWSKANDSPRAMLNSLIEGVTKTVNLEGPIPVLTAEEKDRMFGWAEEAGFSSSGLGTITGLGDARAIGGFSKATQMKRAGASAVETMRDTGWADFGKDWGWLRELSDKDAILKIENFSQVGNELRFSGKLSDALGHPELFEAYSKEMAKLSAELIIAPGQPSRGKLTNEQIVRAEGSTPLDVLKTVLHEGQHRIGQLQKWPRGGDPEEFEQLLRGVGFTEKDANTFGYLLYRRLADEEIARATSDRMTMSSVERRNKPFWYSTEHSPDKWIKAKQTERLYAEDPRVVEAVLNIADKAGVTSRPLIELRERLAAKYYPLALPVKRAAGLPEPLSTGKGEPGGSLIERKLKEAMLNKDNYSINTWKDIKELPEGLQKFVKDDASAEKIRNFDPSEAKPTVLGVAPPAKNLEQFYRPANQLDDGTVVWHEFAKTHRQALDLNFNTARGKSVTSSGGLDPAGNYWEFKFFGDDVIKGSRAEKESAFAQTYPTFEGYVARMKEMGIPLETLAAEKAKGTSRFVNVPATEEEYLGRIIRERLGGD